MDTPTGTNPPQLPDRRWQELCTHIRTTDDISFKLLGLVPLVSIAGLAAPLLKSEPKFSPLVVLLSLFAATVTLALWIWERRNIQTCMWLRDRAAGLEGNVIGQRTPGHFYAFPAAPAGLGKTHAEKFVYGLTIAAWLLLPGAILTSDSTLKVSTLTTLAIAGYAFAALWIGLRAWRELRLRIEVKPDFPSKDV